MPFPGTQAGPRSPAAIEAWPKAELHLHLRGAIPPDLLVRLMRRYSPTLALRRAAPRHGWMLHQPNVREAAASGDARSAAERLFRFRSFDEFLAAYLFTSYFVRDIEDFRDLVRAVVAALHRQNIVYAEITVSLPEYVQQGIPLPDLLAVLGEAPDADPRVRWIVDPVRNLGPSAAEGLLRRVLASRPRSVVGLTLGGAEHLYPPAPFRRLYEMAREAGLGTTVHAGEALGPESVREALRVLDVKRVGHGVRASEDCRLVRELAERAIPLEICPTSNVRTGVCPSHSEHPVRELYQAGVQIAISTDDPTFFGVTLADELAGLRRLGFDWGEIRELADNGFRFAFDPGETAP